MEAAADSDNMAGEGVVANDEGILFQMGTMSKPGRHNAKAERTPAAAPPKEFQPIFSTLRTPPGPNGDLNATCPRAKLPVIQTSMSATDSKFTGLAAHQTNRTLRNKSSASSPLPITTKQGAWPAGEIPQHIKQRVNDNSTVRGAWSDTPFDGAGKAVHEPFDGQMALRIMNKLKQVEEYMRKSKQGAGGGGTGAGASADAGTINELSSRMMELEERLAESEAARMASQSRFEKLLQQTDKSMKKIQQDMEESGSGRSKMKEMASAVTSTTAALDKLKSTVTAMERRIVEVESAAADLLTKSSAGGVPKAELERLKKEVKGSMSEVEQMGSKVHELEVAVQQWTRGYSSTGAQPNGDRSAAVDPAVFDAYETRLAKVEAMEERVQQVEGAYEDLSKKVETGMEERQATEMAHASGNADLGTQVTALEQKMSELAEQLPSMKRDVEAGISSLAAKTDASISTLSEQVEQLAKQAQASPATVVARSNPTSTAGVAPAAGTSTMEGAAIDRASPPQLHGQLSVSSVMTRGIVEEILEDRLADYEQSLVAMKQKMAELMKSVVSRIKTLETIPSTPSMRKSLDRPMTGQDQALLEELTSKVKGLENNLRSFSISQIPDDAIMYPTNPRPDTSTAIRTEIREVCGRVEALEAKLDQGSVAAASTGDTGGAEVAALAAKQVEDLQRETQKNAAELLALVNRITELEGQARSPEILEGVQSKLASLEASSASSTTAYEQLSKKVLELEAAKGAEPGGPQPDVAAQVQSLEATVKQSSGSVTTLSEQVQTVQGQVTSLMALSGRVEQLEVATKKAALASASLTRDVSLARRNSSNGGNGAEGGEASKGEVSETIKKSISSSAATTTKKANERMDKMKTALVNQIKAVEEKVAGLEAKGTGEGGGGGDSSGEVAHLAARIDLIEPMITDIEAASNEKIEGLQSKVTSVLQLLLERVKKLETAFE